MMASDYRNNFEEVFEAFCIATGTNAFSVKMDDDFTLIYGDKGYYDLLEYTPEEMQEISGNKCIQFIHPENQHIVRLKCQRALEQGRKRIEWEMCIITRTGKLKYVKTYGAISQLNGTPVMHGFVRDITGQKKRHENNTLNENALRIVMDQTNITLWTLDIAKKQIVLDRNSPEIFGFDTSIKNVPEYFFENGVIHPDDAPKVQQMFDDIFAGKKSTGSIARWKHTKSGHYWWAKITYTTIYDENEHPVKAIGSAIDISEQVALQEKYDNIMSCKNIGTDNIIGSFRLNLTQNRCSDGQCIFPHVLKLQTSGTVDGFFDMVYRDIPDPQQKEQYINRFDREKLIASFKAGVTHLFLEHRYKIDNNRYDWITTHVNITRNPVTRDIEAIIYAFNIQQTRLMQQIIEHTVESDYDYIAMVNIHDESHLDIINHKTKAILPDIRLKTYTEVMNNLIMQETPPEKQEEILRRKSLQTVIHELEHKDSYILTYEAIQQDGSIAHKQLRFSYMDREAGYIVFNATDITRTIETERQKNELLKSALIAAKQANTAKTDFLSRMSHEIRTPMNAIIGMSAIASQSIDDPRQVSDCIAKIGISSRFLLSLINDILDMSRIESGKILLRNEKIPFTELIGSINSICYAQAAARDIDYECTVDSEIDVFYMGDAMKLQQVLLNILSNAIKFTNSKGKVSFDIRQLKKTETSAELRFSINDTGCGISEEFLPFLFDAFAQEHSENTTQYSGTGLGLAICKNLVELMGGKINVRSIVDAGTEFVVTVKLGLTEETKASYLKKITYNFNQLNALVVDDDVTVCQQAIVTLKELGITSEWVDSGKKAIDQVTEKWAKACYYDLILLDWKMPDMDGIETAREIRKIVGPDVTIIIMTAYDWESIEHEAKLAGVNLMMSKPLFKSSLISAFHKAFNDKKEETTRVEEFEFNFDGKRIMLVEDHPLNVEIAKMLLERKGCLVDHAGNGLRAIEMFTLAQENYYDAILMDVRMPVMDGLQAAKGIRNLSNRSAKTVPIIAMTANAFDDDVEKSKKAGMNAHLTKPIDPAQLYSTLYHYISGESEE